MENQSSDNLALRRQFLQPANAAHRRYEALRAFLVEGLSSEQAAHRFGYSPGSFRVLVHHFRRNPARPFFLSHATVRITGSSSAPFGGTYGRASIFLAHPEPSSAGGVVFASTSSAQRNPIPSNRP